MKETRDDNADGTADHIRSYTYDANGNLLTYSVDRDGDSNANHIESRTYDANGDPLTLTQTSDSNDDGTADRTR